MIGTSLKSILTRQFCAAIDTLDRALAACPDELWAGRMWKDPNMPPAFSEFWYVAYHALFWLDLYLGGAVENFTPPAPFTLSELDPQGQLPERPYTRAELRAYLAHSRRKCQETIAALSAETALRPCRFTWGEMSFGELLLDNMRHTQEHAAQLHMFLGQHGGLENRN